MSVTVDTPASTNRITVKGFTKAWISRAARLFCFSRVTLLAPYLSWDASAWSVVSPPGPVPYRSITSFPSRAAASRSQACVFWAANWIFLSIFSFFIVSS